MPTYMKIASSGALSKAFSITGSALIIKTVVRKIYMTKQN